MEPAQTDQVIVNMNIMRFILALAGLILVVYFMAFGVDKIKKKHKG